MTLQAKQSLTEDVGNSSLAREGAFTSLISRANLWKRLKRSRDTRTNFVDSHLGRSIAYQVRAIRDKKGWTQGRLAKEMGVDRNNISARLENPHYSSHSISSLRKFAKAADVGLVVWFVPFSRMVDWVTGTPYEDKGLTPAFYSAPDFDHDQLQSLPDNPQPEQTQRLDQISESSGWEELGSHFDSPANLTLGAKRPLNNQLAGSPALGV